MDGEWPKEQIPTVITNFPFTLSCSLMSTSLLLLLLPPTLSNHSSLKHCFLHVSPLLTKLPSFPVAHRNDVPNTSAGLSRPSWVRLYPDLSISLPSFLPPTPPQASQALPCSATPALPMHGGLPGSLFLLLKFHLVTTSPTSPALGDFSLLESLELGIHITQTSP